MLQRMKRPGTGSLVFLWIAVMLLTRADERIMLGADSPNVTASHLKYEEPRYLAGAIYGRQDHQLLFKFERVAHRAGSTLRVQRDFTYPNGTLAARERIIYEGDDLLLYELEEAQTGASGKATLRRSSQNPGVSSIAFEYTTGPGSRPKVHSEALANSTLTSDMVAPFLTAHWDELQHSDTVRCRYIVIPRTETVGFTFVKESQSTVQGRSVLIVRMEPSSLLLSALVDPLFFTLEEAPPHRVLQYAGRTTPKVSVGGKWKELDALTVFDWQSAH